MLAVQDRKFSKGIFQTIELEKAKTDEITLVIKPTRSLDVTVTDAEGRPIKDAKVSLGFALEGYSKIYRTDIDGKVVINSLVEGCENNFFVNHDGYYWPTVCTYLPIVGSLEWTGHMEASLMEAKRTITGKVVDEDDKPLPGIEVRAIQHNHDPNNRANNIYIPIGTKMESDANGEFILKNLPDTEIKVNAESMESGYYGGCIVEKDQNEVILKLRKMHMSSY
ncbi:MAG: carboxypeptidase-like regulatory domain-containing protein [Armatimonadota bacterium]